LLDNDSLRDNEDGLIVDESEAEKREVDRMINTDSIDTNEEIET
jgi:hypothetical protein